MQVEPVSFGSVGGKPAALYTLRNAAGMQVAVTDFGARVVSVKVPASSGEAVDVVLGYDDAAGLSLIHI